MQLCASLVAQWIDSGYDIEGQRWAERVLAVATADDDPSVAAILAGLCHFELMFGQYDQGRRTAWAAAAMWGRLDEDANRSRALSKVAQAAESLGELESAGITAREALALAEEADDLSARALALDELASLALAEGHPLPPAPGFSSAPPSSTRRRDAPPVGPLTTPTGRSSTARSPLRRRATSPAPNTSTRPPVRPASAAPMTTPTCGPRPVAPSSPRARPPRRSPSTGATRSTATNGESKAPMRGRASCSPAPASAST